MDENSSLIIVDDVEVIVMPTQSKSRQRKSTAGERKIHHTWTDDEINRLFVSVEQHRGLWDFSSTEYKLTKLDGWQSVEDELKVEGVDVNEAKVKWSSLRTTYMVNLSKLRKNKSGQGSNELYTVSWKFFKSMMFLVDNNAQHSTSSTLQLESSVSECTTVEDCSITLASPISESKVGKHLKRSRSKTPTLASSPTSARSSGSQAISILNSAVAALHSYYTNSTFCDNLLAELRTLSETKAKTLRYKISRLMMDFMEASEEVAPSVQLMYQNEQDVSDYCEELT